RLAFTRRGGAVGAGLAHTSVGEAGARRRVAERAARAGDVAAQVRTALSRQTLLAARAAPASQRYALPVGAISVARAGHAGAGIGIAGASHADLAGRAGEERAVRAVEAAALRAGLTGEAGDLVAEIDAAS